MKILFLSIGDIPSIKHREIYPDLLREFIKNGHEVYVVCSREKRTGLQTELIEEDGAKLLKVHIGNITKTNLIEKGISTLLVGTQYKAAIKKYFADVCFDLIMYSTPPITLAGVVEYMKKRDGACTYLLLKDIFPQNAVDIGLMSKTGIKGLLYKHFRNQEKKLYRVSDQIGCMSQANVEYVINHNPEVNSRKVEVCPNCIEVYDKSIDDETRKVVRAKYGIPEEKKVFVYGGNLGKPQGIPFLIECLRKASAINNAFFLIVGDGTEYGCLNDYVTNDKPRHVQLMRRIPKEDYDTMVGACDVGLIFLDNRFTIPNFPSRLLAYMQAKLPVYALTDTNTDVGKVITEGGFGWWSESKDPDQFVSVVCDIIKRNDLDEIGEKGWEYLTRNYQVSEGYKIIVNSTITKE